jgi:hypothetical protein
MNSRNQHKWPPDQIKEFFNQLLVKRFQLSESDKQALERCISPNNANLKKAYDSLIEKHDTQLINQYFEAVLGFYSDIEMLQPIREKEYKDWLRKLSRKAVDLAALVSQSPSADLNNPEWLCNLDSVLQSVLEGYGDDIAKKQFMAIDPHLKRLLKGIPVTMLLDAFAKLADEAQSLPPVHYWEKEYGIKVPRKHGDDGILAREQIAVKGIKRLTLKFFDEPRHELVTTLVNTLLGKERFTVDSISKTPL